MIESCKKCRFFKSRQGTGRDGECRFNPPVYVPTDLFPVFPEVNESLWCGKFFINLQKYQPDGKKIYTRKGQRVIRNQAQLEAYHCELCNWTCPMMGEVDMTDELIHTDKRG